MGRISAAITHNGEALRQFLKYGIVGVSNTAIQWTIYTIGLEVGVQYLVASTVGYVAGALNSYLLNRRWTFRAGHVSHATAGSRFALVTVCAISSNGGFLYLFVDVVHIEKHIAQLIATLIVLTVTFLVNKLWTFAHHGDELALAPHSPAQ